MNNNCKSIDEQQAIVEARVRKLSWFADNLLAEIDGTDATTAEELRTEATRLYSTAFDITAALARGDIGKAYLLSVGDDVGSTSLGLTA